MAAALLIFQLGTIGQAKSIRLRNELIETDSGTNRAVMAAAMHAQAAATGLFLMQFNGPLEPARRVALRTPGVQLLPYAPVDPLIAKSINVLSASVGALSFVT